MEREWERREERVERERERREERVERERERREKRVEREGEGRARAQRTGYERQREERDEEVEQKEGKMKCESSIRSAVEGQRWTTHAEPIVYMQVKK